MDGLTRPWSTTDRHASAGASSGRRTNCRIKHRREYLEGVGALPDWRITCFFVHSEYRRRGVAAAALEGALRETARLGGGMVESYPEDVAGRLSLSASFLHNGTLAMFDSLGFSKSRRLRKHHWVVTKVT